MAGAVRALPARLREISGLLAGRFGRPGICAHETDPVRNLVLTILSQNTTDANRDRAYDRLAKRFPTLPGLASARPPEVEEAMEAAGKVYEPVIYEGAGHGFVRAGAMPDAEEANRRAREQAWQRWKELLGKL